MEPEYPFPIQNVLKIAYYSGKSHSQCSIKMCLHDISWLVRVKYPGCARRRSMQVMGSSTGLTLKRSAASTILLV